MPMTLNVGLSKKIGLPEFGSIGASVNLELELDSGAVSDPDRLRQQIRHLFGLAKASVEDELVQHQSGQRNGNRHGQDPQATGSGGNGRGNPNGNHGPRPTNGRTATQSQLRAINAIAGRQRLDLANYLQQFGVRAIEDLNVQQASRLIDDLKAQPAETGGTR